MKRFDVEQGSYEWLRLRLGIITASEVHRIMPPPKRKPTERTTLKVLAYRDQILTEWLLGQPIDSGRTQFMQRGTDLEADAVRRFEFDWNLPVERLGFCLNEDRGVGCSVDGLVGERAGLEIKVFEAVHHVHELLSEPDDAHKPQIQCCLWVTGRSEWMRMYWHPTLPPKYVTIKRDPSYINLMDDEVTKFQALVEAGKRRLLEMGCTPKKPRDPLAYCREIRSDGRHCMRRTGVTMTEYGLRCDQHAEPVPAGAGG